MKSIVLLHGAVGAAHQFEKLKQELAVNYQVFTMDFTGHGERSSEESDFSIESFASDLDHFLTTNELIHPFIFGYSMGGFVACYHALHFSNKAEKIITLGTKFYWTPDIAKKEIKMLEPKIISEKIPQFALQLKQRHGDIYWENILTKTASMMVKMGKDCPIKTDDFMQLEMPVCYGLGDRDTMVSLDETWNAYKHTPAGSMYILPETPHPVEKVKVSELVWRINQFLKG